MKLQGKKTGEFANFVGYIDDTPTIDTQTCSVMLTIRYKDAGVNCYKDYNTIAEFNADWEDYEESKEFLYISQDGLIYSDNTSVAQDGYIERLQLVGNYFETKEQAKKALEKLKAWKTLRDNKVHFDLATLADETTVTIFARKKGAIHEYDKELFLLFGENDIDGREE